MTINNIQDYINAIEKLKNKYTYEMGGGSSPGCEI